MKEMSETMNFPKYGSRQGHSGRIQGPLESWAPRSLTFGGLAILVPQKLENHYFTSPKNKKKQEGGVSNTLILHAPVIN